MKRETADMNGPIRIPVSKETPVNAGWLRVPIGEVLITPDLARQIVALAYRDCGTKPALPAPAPVDAGPAELAADRAALGKPDAGWSEPAGCSVSPLSARTCVRGTTGCVIGHKNTPPADDTTGGADASPSVGLKPAPPTNTPPADDAAVEAMAAILMRGPSGSPQKVVGNLLAAIRRGEVPLPQDIVKRISDKYMDEQVCCSGQECGCRGMTRWAEAIAPEIAGATEQLRAEVADLRAKLAAAETSVRNHENGLQAKFMRDRVAELEASVEEEQINARSLVAERDKALTDLAAYKEALSGAQDNAAQWKERAEKAEALAKFHDLQAQRIMIAETAAEKERDAARAEADALRSKLGEAADKYLSSAIKYDERCSQLVEALVQRDEARQERDALKARKVKLPKATTVHFKTAAVSIDVMGPDEVRAAIRAAGIEVEG